MGLSACERVSVPGLAQRSACEGGVVPGAVRAGRECESGKQIGVADVWQRSRSWSVSTFLSYVCFNGNQTLSFVHSLDS